MNRDIETIYGSHSQVLRGALAELPPGSLVIEHGPGIYSSPVIALHDVRVVAVEKLAGWESWTSWYYALHGRSVRLVENAKRTLDILADASIVFVDGENRDRGRMLGWALERGVPTIIAHDTEEDTLDWYLYTRAHLTHPGYTVTHDGERPRTTVWRRL